jgi:hypothetical protein
MQRIRLSEAKEILEKSGYIVESEVVVSSFKDRVMECLRQLCDPLLKNPYDPEDVFEKAYNIYKRKYSDGYDAFDTAKEMVARYRFMVKWHEI